MLSTGRPPFKGLFKGHSREFIQKIQSFHDVIFFVSRKTKLGDREDFQENFDSSESETEVHADEFLVEKHGTKRKVCWTASLQKKKVIKGDVKQSESNHQDGDKVENKELFDSSMFDMNLIMQINERFHGLSCPICGVCFSFKKGLEDHMKHQHCKDITPSAIQSPVDHKMSHKDVNCHLCHIACKTRTSFLNHIKKVHPTHKDDAAVQDKVKEFGFVKNKFFYKCLLCHKHFQEYQPFRYHLKQCHKAYWTEWKKRKSSREYTCHLCSQ